MIDRYSYHFKNVRECLGHIGYKYLSMYAESQFKVGGV